jgi:hypothetical protein
MPNPVRELSRLPVKLTYHIETDSFYMFYAADASQIVPWVAYKVRVSENKRIEWATPDRALFDYDFPEVTTPFNTRGGVWVEFAVPSSDELAPLYVSAVGGGRGGAPRRGRGGAVTATSKSASARAPRPSASPCSGRA